jgi:hypothetical protein
VSDIDFDLASDGRNVVGSDAQHRSFFRMTVLRTEALHFIMTGEATTTDGLTNLMQWKIQAIV